MWMFSVSRSMACRYAMTDGISIMARELGPRVREARQIT